MPIKSFLDLEVYKDSLLLSKDVNILLKSYPASEKFLLVDQMNRASRGIPSLLAEAWAKRRNLRQFKKYLQDAIAEANEMMNHLEQSRLFKYISDSQAQDLIERYDHLAAKISKLKDNWQNY